MSLVACFMHEGVYLNGEVVNLCRLNQLFEKQRYLLKGIIKSSHMRNNGGAIAPLGSM